MIFDHHVNCKSLYQFDECTKQRAPRKDSLGMHFCSSYQVQSISYEKKNIYLNRAIMEDIHLSFKFRPCTKYQILHKSY